VRVGTLAAVVLATLAFAPPARAADADIEHAVVSRSAEDVITFRIEFAAPVDLEDVERVQVAIDADRDLETGIDGLEYSLDYTRYASLLSAVDGDQAETRPKSLRFEHVGNVITFSIAASDIGSVERFDFYTFVEQDGHRDIAPVHELFSASWTYPRDGVASGDPYPTETYEDLMDNTIGRATERRIRRHRRRPARLEHSSQSSAEHRARGSGERGPRPTELRRQRPLAPRRRAPVGAAADRIDATADRHDAEPVARRRQVGQAPPALLAIS
jgi:hypothetical protein